MERGQKPAELQRYCGNCQRWYRPSEQHVCAIDTPIDQARIELELFLGPDATIYE